MSAFHKRFFDLGRDRTCNLLIRSQTRYPLRHKATVRTSSLYYLAYLLFHYLLVCRRSIMTLVQYFHPSKKMLLLENMFFVMVHIVMDDWS